MNLKFTDKSSDAIKRAVKFIADSAPDDLEKSIDFVSDISDTFDYLLSHPHAGVPCEFTIFEGTRFTHLKRHTGFILLYKAEDDDLLIIDIMASWMSV